MLWVDGEGYYFKIGAIFKRVINVQHVALHNGADRRAAGKKEIGHVNIAVQFFAAGAIAILVNEGKGGYSLVYSISYRLPVHGFGNRLPLTVKRQRFLAAIPLVADANNP